MGKDVRTQLRPGYLVVGNVLDCRPIFGRNPRPVLDPLADGLLREAMAHEVGNALSESRLTAGDSHGALQRKNMKSSHVAKITSTVVPVNNSTCSVTDNIGCKVRPAMPYLKRTVAPQPRTNRQRVPRVGADGRTLGERLQLAMDARSKNLGRKYTPAQLRRDANMHAGRRNEAEDEVISQQNLSLILADRNFESAATPALAAALDVRAIWLAYGAGFASAVDDLASPKK